VSSLDSPSTKLRRERSAERSGQALRLRSGQAARSKPQDCPVAHQAEMVLESSQQLAKAMRQMRRLIRNCRSCESAPLCPVMEEFNVSFLEALAEITEEWELGRWYG